MFNIGPVYQCRKLTDHPFIPLLRRGGGGAAGVVFLSVCRKLTDHPVSPFGSATPPKEGN